MSLQQDSACFSRNRYTEMITVRSGVVRLSMSVSRMGKNEVGINNGNTNWLTCSVLLRGKKKNRKWKKKSLTKQTFKVNKK